METIITAVLFIFQHIPAALPFLGPMIAPLGFYIFFLLFGGYGISGAAFLEIELNILLFKKELMFGRVVAVAGFIVILIAIVQFLRVHGALITTGLYSVVRHPQYLGIIVMTLGLSMMSLQHVSLRTEVLYVWLVEVLGYILLARFEERYLVRDYEKAFRQYRQRVPFIFPIPCPARIPETVFSMMLALSILFLCLIPIGLVRFG